MSLLFAKNHGSNHKRKSLYSIMANTGFGDLVVHRSDGTVVEVPQSQITRAGLIKRNLHKKLQEIITADAAEILAQKGVKVYAKELAQ